MNKEVAGQNFKTFQGHNPALGQGELWGGSDGDK